MGHKQINIEMVCNPKFKDKSLELVGAIVAFSPTECFSAPCGQIIVWSRMTYAVE